MVSLGRSEIVAPSRDRNATPSLRLGPRINSPLGVWALDRDASHVYVGGDFTKISGKLQSHFAVLSE